MKSLTARLGSVELRLFLILWIIFAAHFATNVVREHYPAFSLIERGDFILDDYVGFHSDIFVHSDGHAYIANQVAGSLPAVIPLLLFDPLLDALEQPPLEAPGDGEIGADYQTEYPNRAYFLQLVKQKGWHLRFGAATVVTSAFLMSPLAALFCVFIYTILRRRGVDRGFGLALVGLFAFGTPLFYRTAYLNHNVFLMMCTFTSFWLLWPQPQDALPIKPWRVAAAGFLAGYGVAIDYAGAVPLLWLYGYLIAVRTPAAGFRRSFFESLRFVAGSVPPVLFLWWSQWSMFGNPFLPAQYYMPVVNFTDRGWRGFDWPQLDVFWKNLFDPDWGMYVFAPVLLLGLLPARVHRDRHSRLILPLRERRAATVFIVLFLLFCAANQYSLMQWNTGFRYLLPLLPFIFLALCDHLVRWPRWVFALIAIPSVAHMWVLSTVRYTRVDFGLGSSAIVGSWERFLADGVRLPWLTVLRQTTPDPASLVHAWFLPSALLAFAALMCAVIWWIGGRFELAARQKPSASAAQSAG